MSSYFCINQVCVSVCVWWWERCFYDSNDMTKFGDLAYRVNPDGSALGRYIDICNLFFKSNSLTWCIFMIIPPRWVILEMHDIVILHFRWLYHGLFASTFKVLIGLPLVMLLTRHGRIGVWRWVHHQRHPCELGHFRVKMPVGVGLMAWAPA